MVLVESRLVKVVAVRTEEGVARTQEEMGLIAMVEAG